MKSVPLRHLLLSVTLAAPLLAAGCDDSARVQSLEGEVTALDSQVKKLEAEREKLLARLDTAERRMTGLQEDLLAVRRSAEAAGAVASAASEKAAGEVAGAPVAAPPGVPAPGSKDDPRTVQAAQELAALLASETGTAVFEGALRRVEQKRDEERGARMVAGMVDAFAQRANLTPQQSEQMRKIVGKTMTDIGSLWRSMGDGDLTPEERAAKRQETFAKAEEIRKSTEDEVRNVLDAQQFEMFQQESARMRGFLGGGPGGGFGGRGGMGGRGQ